MTVPFAAALSRHPDPRVAIGEVVGGVLEELGPGPDVAALFFTGHHLPAARDLAAAVQALLSPQALVGASAVAVLAAGEGAEDVPGVSLWAGRLGGAEPRVAALQHARDLAELLTADDGTVVVVADPFSFPIGECLAVVDAEHPGVHVVGGLASAGTAPGANRLVVGTRGATPEVLSGGAVALVLPRGVAVRPVVSQGCRPIGRPWVVTAAERNVLVELGGRPALDRVAETLQSLDADEQVLAAQGLHCGIVVDEHLVDFDRGDFLIRGVLGADRERRTVVIGDEVAVGSTVQFQVRDASTAAEDLQVLVHGATADASEAGALLFTCNGRGSYMFGDADHDARIVRDHVGPAVAGMFCAGEIGPVAGRTALHGFTASLAVFRDPGTVDS